jgi:hypothetical protein
VTPRPEGDDTGVACGPAHQWSSCLPLSHARARRPRHEPVVHAARVEGAPAQHAATVDAEDLGQRRARRVLVIAHHRGGAVQADRPGDVEREALGPRAQEAA